MEAPAQIGTPPLFRDRLTDTSLIRTTHYIDGQWTDHTEESYEVMNPATDEAIASVAMAGASDTKSAIEAAGAAFKGWSKMLASERAALLMKWHGEIEQARDDVAQIMTAECGKPLFEAQFEITAGLGSLKWMAEEAERVCGEVLQPPMKKSPVITFKQPVGVVGAITPWNFPMAMITRKCAPALAAGCTIVLKPSEQTPLTAYALVVLAERAGLPKGVLNVLSGSSKDIGKTLTSHETIRKIGFTGSTRTGKLLMEQSASTVKRVSMELGGNAPFIVFADADLDLAAKQAVATGLMNAGQVCISGNRLFVHEDVYDEFREKMSVKMKAVTIGDGAEEGTDMGPCINQQQADWAKELVDDAVGKGADVVTGGTQPDGLKGYFFEPTLLANATQEMRIFSEETFAPALPMFKFSSDKEVIDMANDTQYGLAGYLFSRDLKRCWDVANELEYGMIGVNETMVENYNTPFGGVKQSGIGRENGNHGIDEFLEVKTVYLGLGYAQK